MTVAERFSKVVTYFCLCDLLPVMAPVGSSGTGNDCCRAMFKDGDIALPVLFVASYGASRIRWNRQRQLPSNVQLS